MDFDDLTKRLDEVIAKVTDRNKTVQEKKKSGPWGWVVGAVLALLSLVGIGVALYLAGQHAKELAKLRTKVEQDKVAQDQRAFDAKAEPLLRKRRELIDQLKQKESAIQARTEEIQQAEEALRARESKIDSLRAWAEINAA